ncbi:MAG: alpha/beta fold hydrolase [Pseudomonas sp.]
MNTTISVMAAVRGWHLPVAGLAFTLLGGCFSGSGSSSSSDSTQTGVFLDSPVSGLSYAIGSTQQRTDADGRFNYRKGDDLTFLLGGLELGSALGDKVITPLDLVADGSAGDPAVLNISRLLQSLDSDGNLNNGIQISEQIDQAVADYLTANAVADLDFADTAAFETVMTGLLAELNQLNLFAENANNRDRALRSRLQAWQHLSDTLAQQDGLEVNQERLPVLFIHGGAGSASQFESQAQRFRANGYPATHIAAFEYDSGTLATDPLNAALAVERHRQINALVDELLLSTGADKINLLGHSLGTSVSQMYLADPANAAKVAHYVNIDGRSAAALPGGVPTLALWGQYVTEAVVGAENVYPPEEDPVGHIEVATSADSFVRMYRFFNDEDPQTSAVPAAEDDHVWLAGKANLFPQNTGASGARLEVYTIDPVTGARLNDVPLYEQEIDASGAWGPWQVEKGASVEYALLHGEGQDQYFYREPYNQDSLLVRLNTSRPNEGVGRFFHRSPAHTNLMIGRDMELWGDQGDNNDSLTISGTEVISEMNAPLLHRLSVLFLHDRNSDQTSNLTQVDPAFGALPFMSGLDMYLPASAGGSGTIEVRLQSRRGGDDQVIRVPNWPSNQVRSVSLQFKDYSQ